MPLYRGHHRCRPASNFSIPNQVPNLIIISRNGKAGEMTKQTKNKNQSLNPGFSLANQNNNGRPVGSAVVCSGSFFSPVPHQTRPPLHHRILAIAGSRHWCESGYGPRGGNFQAQNLSSLGQAVVGDFISKVHQSGWPRTVQAAGNRSLAPLCRTVCLSVGDPCRMMANNRITLIDLIGARLSNSPSSVAVWWVNPWERTGSVDEDC